MEKKSVVQQEYEEFVVDGDINSSEIVLGYRARRGGINITLRRHNVTLYVHCLFCNLQVSRRFLLRTAVSVRTNAMETA